MIHMFRAASRRPQPIRLRTPRTRELLMLLAVASVLQLPQAIPCNGSRTTTPTCGKTVVLTKVGPSGPIIGAGAAGFFTYPVNVFARGSNFLPAPNCPQPVSAVVDITLHCDPGPDSTGSSGVVPIGPGYSDIDVIVTVQNGPPRECRVSATATVTFDDGSVVTSVCDNSSSDRGPTVCIVDPVAPGTPRLDLERLTPGVVAVHAGGVGLHRYRIRNNDPAARFSGLLCVGSKNTATIPEDTSGTGNVFGVSDPAGDAFGVYFADEIPPGVCPPLPPAPHRQYFRDAKRRIDLLPGQEIVVDMLHRPYGGCATGSCSESRVRLRGLFNDGSVGLACTNAAVVVDNAIPADFFSCQGVGSIGRVIGIDPATKAADFQISVAPPLKFGGHLPVRVQGDADFPGLQIQSQLLQEDNNESVRDVASLRDPGGAAFPPGAVLQGALFLEFFDPSSNNLLFLSSMNLARGAPTGLSHLAPVVKAMLDGIPLSPTGPETQTEVMIQYGALGFQPGATGTPIPLPIRVIPDLEGVVDVRIVIPDNGLLFDRVDLVCDLRMYGAARVFNPPLGFQGNLVGPLGNAGINVDASRGLVVSNIGSSGLDGVSIDLGETNHGSAIGFDQPIPLPGAQLRLQATGRVDGNPNEQPLGDIHLFDPGSEPFIGRLSCDFTPFAAQNTLVQVFGNGRVVGTVILPPSGELGTLRGLDPAFGLPQLTGCGKFAPGFPYPLPCFYLEFDRLGEFSFPGRGPLIGDRIAMFASGSPLQLDGVTGLDLEAAGLPGGQLVISNIGSSGQDGVGADPESPADRIRREQLENRPAAIPDHAVHLFGHSHLALGDAALLPSADRLVVSNIGSSGEDGVRIDLGPEDTFEALLLPAVNLRMPGSRFEASGLGTVGGTPGQALGSFGCQNNGGIVQAVADYKTLGVPDVELRLLLGGVLQQTITVPCGVVGTVLPGPSGGFPQIRTCGKRPPFGPPCFYIETDRPVRFTPAGGDVVICDRVEALAVGLPEPLEALESFVLRGTNLGVLGIGGESQPRVPQVESVEPAGGTTGDLIRISGSGFDPDPDNNCAIVMMDDGNPVAIPLEVISSTATELRARLGAIPPDIRGTGQVMVATGRGQRGFFEPAFPGIEVLEPVWVWDFTGLEVPDGPPFTPTPTPPPPTTVWFEQPMVVGGEMCLSFADPDSPDQPFLWPDPCKIQINARLRDHSDFYGFDQFAACLRFTNTTTPRDCAERICDSIRCAWFQQAGILVSCRVEVDAAGVPTIYLGFGDGVHQVDWGTFSVCVTALEEPVITALTPTTGTTGDIVTIEGRGFGDDPDDLCVIAMIGDQSIGVEVLGARDHRIIGRLGAVPPNPGPAQIMVARGEGQRGNFVPVFPDIVQEEPVWVWDFRAGETLVGVPFDLVHTPPEPNDLWFFSGAPQDGQMRLTIPRFDWDPGCKIQISARMRDHPSNRGHDHLSSCIRFPQAGSFEDCMARICDTIRCSWSQMAGIPVTCELSFTANDGTISLGFPPPFRVGWGNLTVCIDCPDPVPTAPVIEFVDRTVATTGDVVRVTGNGFGDDPDDLCMIQMDGPRSQPFNVDSFFDVFFDVELGQDVIVAPMGVIPPDAQPGRIHIGKGTGLRGRPRFVFDDLSAGADHWGWRNDPRVADFAGPDITPIPPAPGIGEQWFFSEPPQDGMMCIYIDGSWGDQSEVSISGRMRDHSTGKGYDHFSSGMTINGPMSPFECARRICDAITCTWSQLAGVRVICFATPVGNDRAKITLMFENGSIDWGNITICATDLTVRQTYDEWKAENGVIDDLEDLDFDGISAIVEAYLGLNPRIADSIVASTDPLGQIQYRRDPRISGLVAVLECSTNLKNYELIAVNPPTDLLGNAVVSVPGLGLRGFWRFGVRRR